MKRIILLLLTIAMGTTICNAAMSNSRVRKETRFLTDKMAYELKLNTEQYNDIYEINYDFINSIRSLMDDVMDGEEWALNRYYDNLDIRNDDLRWVLNSRQYGRFVKTSYFYRPIYMTGGRWQFRVYITYTNNNHFYFPRPHHYRTYCGGHHRTHHNHASFYRGRYKHVHYNGNYRIRDNKSYHTTRRSDFGSIKIRPNSSSRPSVSTRPTNNSRPAGNRPATNSRPTESRRSSNASSSKRESVKTNSRNSNSSRRSNVESTKPNDNKENSRRSSRERTDGKERK